MVTEHAHIKYALIAVLLHAAILALPISNPAQAPVVRVIDVLVMKQEIAPALAHPQEKPSPAAKLPPPREFVSELKREEQRTDSSVQDKLEDNKNEAARIEPPPVNLRDKETVPGGGNVLDERTIAQLPSGPGPGNGGGVAISGLAVRGGAVGMGTGGTGGSRGPVGAATGNIGPTGTGTGAGAGPVDAMFGQPDGPQFVYRAMPEYPFVARRLRKEGSVVLLVVIDARGELQKIDVVESSDQMFALAAVEAMRRSTFLPAKRRGVPVLSRATLPVRFALRD